MRHLLALVEKLIAASQKLGPLLAADLESITALAGHLPQDGLAELRQQLPTRPKPRKPELPRLQP